MAQARITGRILAFVESHELGIVSTEEGFILQKNPDTVLGPDVAFVSKARLGAEPRTWSDVRPDLAVEVASPSNTRADLERKLRIYLENGVRAVWLVFPERQEVTVHFPDQPVRIVSGDMQLDGGQVLPGFAVSMREIFGDNPGGIPDCQLIASRLLLRSSPSS